VQLPEFIFMLTRADRTIEDAREVYESVAQTGIRHVGCKDLGIPREELAALLEDIRANGHTSYLEVVSETDEDTLQSARVAAELRPDYLIGGTLIEPVQEIIGGSGVRFFPYIGQVVDHPCLLRGTIDEIAQEARHVEELGVDGINLLAYRYDGDVDALVEAVGNATSLPVIAAGSVDSAERIRALTERQVWAFTVGTAALDGKFVAGGALSEQLEFILDAASGVRT
jgi:4-hydroxythreonine-4-phosphate dehydrogenase